MQAVLLLLVVWMIIGLIKWIANRIDHQMAGIGWFTLHITKNNRRD